MSKPKRKPRPKASDVDRGPDFKFVEFNPLRAGRGAEAANVIVNGNWLWMSEADVDRNLNRFGRDPELVKAKLAYSMAAPPDFIPERQELAAFISEQTGEPCEAADILHVRRVRESEVAE